MDLAIRREAIEASLDAAAERLGDPAGLVYSRLFSLHPEMEAYFWRDRDGAIRGEMLARTFAVVLDLVGENRYGAQTIKNEIITHEGYEIPREIFGLFFGVVAAALRAGLEEAWTPQMDLAWEDLLGEIDALLADTPTYGAPNPYFQTLSRTFERSFLDAKTDKLELEREAAGAETPARNGRGGSGRLMIKDTR